MKTIGKVFFIGAGPGDPELITVKGLNIINRAEMIIYAGSLVREQIFEQSKAMQIIDSSGLTLEQTHALMVRACLEGRLTARVHTGDPSVFGAVHEQAALLEKEGIPFEIIPGVTAAFAAAARAGISLTLPEINQTVIITRASGRTEVPPAQDLERLAASRGAIAVYLSSALADSVQTKLLAGGLNPETPVVIGWKVGWDGEMIIRTNIDNLVRDIKDNNITGQAVMLVLPGADQNSRSKLYSPGFAHGYRKG